MAKGPGSVEFAGSVEFTSILCMIWVLGLARECLVARAGDALLLVVWARVASECYSDIEEQG